MILGKRLSFKLAARGISYFGSDSIATNEAAVFELIKNSRDAGSNTVNIFFEDAGRDNTKITIEDEGHGMSSSDIESKWMVLATDDSIKNNKTKSGKTKWGEKGIGRMACQKLGHNLKLKSVSSAKPNEKNVMDFDWRRFEQSGNIDDIKFDLKPEKCKSKDKVGVTLEITGLKSRWDTESIERLKDELGVYIATGKDGNVDDIEIWISVNGADLMLVDSDVGVKKVCKVAPYKLKAGFDGNDLEVSISDSFRKAAKFQKMDVSISPADYPDVGPFSLEIYYFPRDAAKSRSGKYARYYKQQHLEMDELEGLKDKKYYGVYMFRDAAWMKPYGGEYDWLGLEPRRVQRRDRIGSTQIYGDLHLTKNKNPNIRTTSHREKLIENGAYRQLKKLIVKAIGTLENFKKKAEEEDKKEELHEHKDKPDVAKTVLEKMESTMKRGSKSFNQILGRDEADIFRLQVKKVGEWVNEFEDEKKKETEELWQFAQQESALATLGLMTSYMSKQIAEPLENVIENLAAARKIKRKQKELSEKQEEDLLKGLESNTEIIKRFMGFVHILSRHIADMRRSKSKRRDTDVYKVWSDVYLSMKSRVDELNIDILDAPETKLKVRINPIDLYSILSNFYINSIESLRQSKNTKRRIDVGFEWKTAGLQIRFKDNGIGIAKTGHKEVFTAFVSTAATDTGAYHGQGLGLAIVKHIVEHYKGDVYVNPRFGKGDGAEMIVEFPKEEVEKVAAY